MCIAATHEILPVSNFGWAVYTLTSPIVVTQIRNGLFSYRTSFNVAGITVLVGMLSTFVLVIPLIAIWRLRKVQAAGDLHSTSGARYSWLCRQATCYGAHNLSIVATLAPMASPPVVERSSTPTSNAMLYCILCLQPRSDWFVAQTCYPKNTNVFRNCCLWIIPKPPELFHASIPSRDILAEFLWQRISR